MKEKIIGLSGRLELLRNSLSASAFAAKCGIPQPMMDRYMKGENAPSAEKVIQICVACSCSADWLLGLDGASGYTNECESSTKPKVGIDWMARAGAAEAELRRYKAAFTKITKSLKFATEAVEELEGGE